MVGGQGLSAEIDGAELTRAAYMRIYPRRVIPLIIASAAVILFARERVSAQERELRYREYFLGAGIQSLRVAGFAETGDSNFQSGNGYGYGVAAGGGLRGNLRGFGFPRESYVQADFAYLFPSVLHAEAANLEIRGIQFAGEMGYAFYPGRRLMFLPHGGLLLHWHKTDLYPLDTTIRRMSIRRSEVALSLGASLSIEWGQRRDYPGTNAWVLTLLTRYFQPLTGQPGTFLPRFELGMRLGIAYRDE